MSETRMQWVHMQVPETTFETLMMVATTMGLHASQAAAQLLEAAIAEYLEENANLPGARNLMTPEDRALAPIFKTFYAQKRREQAVNMVQVIAARVQRAPSEEAVEELRHFCEAIGLDFSEVMDRTTSDVVAAVADETNEKLALAKRLLLEAMQPGVEYRMKDMQRILKEAGVSESFMKKAKHDLKIKSRRKGEFWIWYRE